MVPVPLFARPERCPFGHSLTPGAPQRVGWQPCTCAQAREAAKHGLGMGHHWIRCETCTAEQRETILYTPSHDINHREPGRWHGN